MSVIKLFLAGNTSAQWFFPRIRGRRCQEFLKFRVGGTQTARIFSRTGQRYFTDKLEDESLARHGWMDIENQSFISGIILQCTIHRTQYSISQQQQNLEIKINCSASRVDRAIIYSEWPWICIVSDVV